MLGSGSALLPIMDESGIAFERKRFFEPVEQIRAESRALPNPDCGSLVAYPG